MATALALVAAYLVLLAAPALQSSKSFGGDPSVSPNQAPVDQLTTEVILTLSLIGIVAFLGWGREARLTSRPAWGGLWYVIAPALITLTLLAFGVFQATKSEMDLSALWTSGLLQSILLLVIFVGIFEEILFRGVLLHGLECRVGPVAALFMSSFVFGAMHYVNWINGQNLEATHQQVLHAGLSGILYGALTLRMRSIWPAVLLHALWDFSVTVNGALMGGMFGAPTDDTTASDFNTMILSFLIRNFEPIFGLIVLFGWWRWQKKQPLPVHDEDT